ncbi:MAG TPA: carbohydrate-binding protein [Gammaproteobacteria bacterium]|nr:carbohydrate-binding protein [Gammaproteobacteria bacterium]
MVGLSGSARPGSRGRCPLHWLDHLDEVFMRKRITGQSPAAEPDAPAHWLDLEPLVTVEVSSEDSAHPAERALVPTGEPGGWQAGVPGEQVMRLVFDRPQDLARVRLKFSEEARVRTQEFVLRWSADAGASFREVLRQQWNFSPTGSTQEIEDHAVDLQGVTILELRITPDIGGGQARASLDELRVA